MLTRFRSKAYRIATLLMLVGVAALALAPSFTGGSDAPRRVGVLSEAVSRAAPGLQNALAAAAEAAGQPVTVRIVEDEEDGRAAVLAGELDVLVRPASKEAPGRLRVLVATDVPTTLRGPLENVARQEALLALVAAAGLDRVEVDAAVSAAGVDLVKLRPGREYDPERIGLGIFAGIFVYVALLLYGQQVAQGVVEEKSSRIVELLLTAIRPWQLMVGKVIGIGLIGLAQLGVTAGTGIALSTATGSFSLPTSTASETAIWTLVWFVLGFAAYALLFAGVGALVSRQEEVGGVSSPVMFVIIAPYVLGVSVLPGDPGNSLVAGLSMIPIFSPTLMPMRVALGVPGWQLAVSVVAMLLLIAALVWLAGRVYGNAVLRTGHAGPAARRPPQGRLSPGARLRPTGRRARCLTRQAEGVGSGRRLVLRDLARRAPGPARRCRRASRSAPPSRRAWARPASGPASPGPVPSRSVASSSSRRRPCRRGTAPS